MTYQQAAAEIKQHVARIVEARSKLANSRYEIEHDERLSDVGKKHNLEAARRKFAEDTDGIDAEIERLALVIDEAVDEWNATFDCQNEQLAAAFYFIGMAVPPESGWCSMVESVKRPLELDVLADALDNIGEPLAASEARKARDAATAQRVGDVCGKVHFAIADTSENSEASAILSRIVNAVDETVALLSSAEN